MRLGEKEDCSEGWRDDGIQVLNECGKVSGHSSILIGSTSNDVTAQEFDDEIVQNLVRVNGDFVAQISPRRELSSILKHFKRK